MLKQCISARAALAELKQAAELIPNQSLLINTLPLLEARASSEIENIVTTADRLFQHARSEEQADAATKEALRYSRALFEGFTALKEYPLSTRTAEQICSRVKGIDMTVRRVPGTALGRQGVERSSIPRLRGSPCCAICWQTGSDSYTTKRPLIR